jgi:hypothetical protein
MESYITKEIMEQNFAAYIAKAEQFRQDTIDILGNIDQLSKIDHDEAEIYAIRFATKLQKIMNFENV